MNGVVKMEAINGNSDASGSLDKCVPYMKETYPQRRARLEQEMANRAADQVKPTSDDSASARIKRMPGNGSFA